VQLCAQALCLEEMLGRPVPAGAIFHVTSRRRREIVFDAALRARTEAAARRLHELFASGETPPPVLKPRCRGCSLRELCLPEMLGERSRAAGYQRALFAAADPD
jgi:CRISPR-associated exonuclease Cas4